MFSLQKSGARPGHNEGEIASTCTQTAEEHLQKEKRKSVLLLSCLWTSTEIRRECQGAINFAAPVLS